MAGRRPRRKAIVATVTQRCSVAQQMGQEMFHPGVEIAEVRQQLAQGQGAYLSTAERDAYDGLMPGTFWAAFSRGWSISMVRGHRA